MIHKIIKLSYNQNLFLARHPASTDIYLTFANHINNYIGVSNCRVSKCRCIEMSVYRNVVYRNVCIEMSCIELSCIEMSVFRFYRFILTILMRF